MKVLLVDTAFAAAPIYDYLIEAGHDVWVIGNRENDILAQRAGARWINQNYSDDRAVAKQAKNIGIECVVPGCTDVSIETCLRLGLNPSFGDTPEVNRRISNKMEFRRICERLDLPAPRLVTRDDFPLTGQFICKPVDAFSGRGITVFDGNDPVALAAAYETATRASPSATAIIEPFIDGSLYSCSTFIEDGQPTTVFYVREGSSAYSFAVDTSYVVHDLPAQHTAMLEKSIEKLCADLGLADGLLHVQFILNDDGPWMIEVMRRCPGDLYSLLIEYSTGFRYAAKYASYFTGAQVAAEQTERRHILRHTVSAVDDTIFGGITFSMPITTRAFFPLQMTGARLAGQQKTRAGILFSEASSPEQLCADYESFLSRRAYRLG